MAMAVATRGNVLIKNVIPKHLEAISSKLIEMGATVIEYDDSVRVMADGDLSQLRSRLFLIRDFRRICRRRWL